MCKEILSFRANFCLKSSLHCIAFCAGPLFLTDFIQFCLIFRKIKTLKDYNIVDDGDSNK